VERWFFGEPLLFAAMMTHRFALRGDVPTVRVGRGRVELSPAFVDTIDDRSLERVLEAEASRILLKHPYERRMPLPQLAYLASNVTLKEHLRTPLPLPTAAETFGTHALDLQYFELYYDTLAREGAHVPTGPQREDPWTRYAWGDDASAALWERDGLLTARIDDVIRDAIAGESWGTVAGSLREHIRAALAPDVDYRDVLASFRARVLASEQRLTRMFPNRRYGDETSDVHQPMGRRPAFTTRMLFALDVSGSMSPDDLSNALGTVQRFFRYGVRSIDLLCFDVELQGPITRLRQSTRELLITGRGGTSFAPVIEHLDQHPDAYDGVVVFTDGCAPKPERPQRCRTPIVWLFSTRRTWERQRANVEHLGRTAFLRNG
jgi:hypothetical protein